MGIEYAEAWKPSRPERVEARNTAPTYCSMQHSCGCVRARSAGDAPKPGAESGLGLGRARGTAMVGCCPVLVGPGIDNAGPTISAPVGGLIWVYNGQLLRTIAEGPSLVAWQAMNQSKTSYTIKHTRQAPRCYRMNNLLTSDLQR